MIIAKNWKVCEAEVFNLFPSRDITKNTDLANAPIICLSGRYLDLLELVTKVFVEYFFLRLYLLYTKFHFLLHTCILSMR